MKRRRITLADGRYLIFYTFEEEAEPSAGVKEEARPREEPKALAEAEEERGV